jgi:hypothetical protein
MISAIFASTNRIKLDELSDLWATEAKNIVLLSGADLTVESAVSFSCKIAKYFMGADTKVIKSEDGNAISLVVRHDGGDNFSFFCSRCFERFFKLFFHLKKVSVDYDTTTIFIKIDITHEDVAAMNNMQK